MDARRQAAYSDIKWMLATLFLSISCCLTVVPSPKRFFSGKLDKVSTSHESFSPLEETIHRPRRAFDRSHGGIFAPTLSVKSSLQDCFSDSLEGFFFLGSLKGSQLCVNHSPLWLLHLGLCSSLIAVGDARIQLFVFRFSVVRSCRFTT